MTQSHQPADLHHDKDSPGYIVSHGRNKPCPPEAGSLHTRHVLAVKQTRDSHSYQYIHSSQPATAEGLMQPIQKILLEITALVIRGKCVLSCPIGYFLHETTSPNVQSIKNHLYQQAVKENTKEKVVNMTSNH